MTITLLHLIIAAILIIAVVIGLTVSIVNLRNSHQSLTEELTKTKRQATKFSLDADALFARVDELDANIQALHKTISPLPDKIAQVEGGLREQQAQDPQVKLYQKAANMAKQGASAEDIATACDLPLAEASVLVSLNQ